MQYAPNQTAEQKKLPHYSLNTITINPSAERPLPQLLMGVVESGPLRTHPVSLG